MDSDLISIIIAIVSFILGFATQWGSQKSTIKTLEEEIKRLDKSIDTLQIAISSLHKEYVSYKHFDVVTAEIKETIRNMGKDIKEILKLIQN